jgi:hypothetical protein
MFGLAPFAGAPFSSALQITTDTSVSGLVATTYLNSVGVQSGTSFAITGVSATTALGAINSNKDPVTWTSVITVQ